MRLIAPIVEGKGELAAVPLLIRRILQAESASEGVRVAKPVEERKGTFLKQGGIERLARLALRKNDEASVLVLIDADDDCAATRGPALQQRLEREMGNRNCAAVLAVREYETWLVGDARSLGRDRAFRDNIRPRGNPETVPDAKRWLNDRRVVKHSYDPGVDQARLTELIDIEIVRQRCPSFDKFWREVVRLATA